MNSGTVQASGQLSLFSIGLDEEKAVTCCKDGNALLAQWPEEWMLALVPDGELVIYIGKHPMILRPVSATPESIPAGNRYYHFHVGGQVYSGIFVGRGNEDYPWDEDMMACEIADDHADERYMYKEGAVSDDVLQS